MTSLIFRIMLTAVISYVLGNLIGAVIVSKTLYKSDVREFGSKNGGLTNFIRVYGKKAAPLVILVDAGKAVCAALLGGALLGTMLTPALGKTIGMCFVILGHMFPVFFHFRGGKGVLSGVSAIMVIDWRVGLVLIGLFAVTLLVSRYVSLGSVLAAAVLPFAAHFIVGESAVTLLLAVMGGLVIYMHRTNIQRLLKGTENKFKL